MKFYYKVLKLEGEAKHTFFVIFLWPQFGVYEVTKQVLCEILI